MKLPRGSERTLTNIQLPRVFGLFSGVAVISVGAHAHYLGKTMQMTATLPGGEMKTLLSIKDWDFAWQDRYFFSDAVSLPKGTRIDAEVSWDNSSDNSRNPSNPPIAVKWGEESKDEMGAVGLQVVPRVESDLSALVADYRKHVRAAATPQLMSDPELRKWVMSRMGAGLGGGR
jgi:hypothetical protein